MGRHVAILNVPFEMLHRALGLPDGVQIDEVRESPDRLGVLQLRLEGGELPYVSEGDVVPSVGAVFSAGSPQATLSFRCGDMAFRST